MRGRVKPKNLRQLVAIETRRRTVAFFVLMAVVLAYLVSTLLFSDTGLFKYLDLKRNEQRLETEIRQMEKEKQMMKAKVDALKGDSYYIEKQAREEYRMAKPGELIFEFKPDGR